MSLHIARRLFLAGLLLFSGVLSADVIAVIGTGQVGSALGPEFAAQGHTIVYGSRTPDRDDVKALVARTPGDASATTLPEAVKGADIVVLAVPGLAVEPITLSLGDVAGKIIIDPTNPLSRRDDGLLGIDVQRSNGEVIQAAAPEAHVVKAFSTLNWRSMIDPESTGGPISIPMVGDSAEAKARVAELARNMGLEPIDVGPLRNARHVESLSVLLLNNQLTDAPDFEFHLRVKPHAD
jgi:predicted dinucleotide-binding enzyme